MKHTLRLFLLLCLFLSIVSAGIFAQESTAEATEDSDSDSMSTPNAEATRDNSDSTSNAMGGSTVEIIEADFEGPAAFVRFLHLVPDGGNVDVYIDGELSDSAGLAFMDSGNWLVLPAGNHSISVSAAGESVDNAITTFDVTLTENEPLIIAIVGNSSEEGPSVLLIRDNYGDVAPGVGTLNFVNALDSDMGVNFLRDDVVFVSAVNAASEGIVEVNNSIDVDADTYTMTATYFGTDEAVAAEAVELDVRDEDNYLVVLTGTEDDPHLLVFETPQAQVNIMRGELEAPGTVLDVLRAMGYDEFVTMLEDAGLAETLTGDGPYTLFVPADYLMDELAASSGDDMTTTLQTYIVEGDLRAFDILKSESDLTTLGGNSYQLGSNQDTLAIGNAQIIDVNNVATNGVIHVINALLTSSSFSEVTPEATAEATAGS
jgi:uncharacterized surface protein with fasciclin (FAS1) repeats